MRYKELPLRWTTARRVGCNRRVPLAGSLRVVATRRGAGPPDSILRSQRERCYLMGRMGGVCFVRGWVVSARQDQWAGLKSLAVDGIALSIS